MDAQVIRECMACEGNQRLTELPPRESVLVTDHWRVAHTFDSALPGWLVILPRRHVRALHELTPDEAAPLGDMLRRLSLALATVTGCEKSYIMLFAEKEGFSHLHVHVVPRMPDFTDDVKGPRVFEFLKQDPEQWLSPNTMDDIALQLRSVLETSW